MHHRPRARNDVLLVRVQERKRQARTGCRRAEARPRAPGSRRTQPAGRPTGSRVAQTSGGAARTRPAMLWTPTITASTPARSSSSTSSGLVTSTSAIASFPAGRSGSRSSTCSSASSPLGRLAAARAGRSPDRAARAPARARRSRAPRRRSRARGRAPRRSGARTRSPSSSIASAATRQASAPRESASAGEPSARHRIGSPVASRRPASSPVDDHPLGALRLGRPRSLRVGGGHDQRDPVALGDRLAQAALARHRATMLTRTSGSTGMPEARLAAGLRVEVALGSEPVSPIQSS